MVTINPYLTFNGNCEEAFNFYKSVFGGEFLYIGRYKDMPPSETNRLPEGSGERIMHVSLPISRETILMGSDAHPAFPPVNSGQTVALSVTAKSKEEADRIFKKLSEVGKITMPVGDTFWGAYFGMMVDKFGFIWMVSYSYPK